METKILKNSLWTSRNCHKFCILWESLDSPKRGVWLCISQGSELISMILRVDTLLSIYLQLGGLEVNVAKSRLGRWVRDSFLFDNDCFCRVHHRKRLSAEKRFKAFQLLEKSFENNDGLGAMLYKGRLTHSGIGAHLKIAHSKLQKTLRRDRRGLITSNFWPCEPVWQLFAAQTNWNSERVSPGALHLRFYVFTFQFSTRPVCEPSESCAWHLTRQTTTPTDSFVPCDLAKDVSLPWPLGLCFSWCRRSNDSSVPTQMLLCTQPISYNCKHLVVSTLLRGVQTTKITPCTCCYVLHHWVEQ